jgi:phosphatidylglycerophosphate synthase
VLRRSLPHALTALRLAAGTAFLFASHKWWLAIAIVAALTDFLDGFLARRWQATTSWSPGFDLVADGVFFIEAFTRFWRDGLWPAWLAGLLLGSLVPELFAQALLMRARRTPGSPGRLWNRVLGGYSYVCVIGIAAGGPAVVIGAGQVLVSWWANLLDVRWAVMRSRDTPSSPTTSWPPTTSTGDRRRAF